jgi:quercetin dioxygenase-like cupin family protein
MGTPPNVPHRDQRGSQKTERIEEDKKIENPAGACMKVIDLKEKEVFKQEDRGFANLVDETYLQINQVCLEPNQQVPHHNANSNVTLLVVYGEGTFHIGNEVVRMGPGKLLRVPLQSPMSIRNQSKERLAFLVMKTPHPADIK